MHASIILFLCTHTGPSSAATSCVGQPAIVPQTFTLAYNLTGSSTVPSARSGAPGYVVGRPVLAGYAYADPAGTGKTAVLPLASGLRYSAHCVRDAVEKKNQRKSIAKSMGSSLFVLAPPR